MFVILLGVQDKLWELDKSWENNLVFYGINMLKDEDAAPQVMETRIREILRVNLGIARDVPILRVKRAMTGSNIRGSKPVTVYFQKYEDKEEILRWDSNCDSHSYNANSNSSETTFYNWKRAQPLAYWKGGWITFSPLLYRERGTA